MISEKEKQQLTDWLITNLQVTSKSNVELIVKHIDYYFHGDHLKQRCEAAEKVISCIPDRKDNLYELGFHQALKIWQTLKEKQL